MTAMNWLQGYVDLSNDVVALGVNLGLQTTLVIGGGLFAAWLCRRRGAAVQSSILRMTLVAALLCPTTSWMLNAVGVPGFRVAVPPGRMLVMEVPQPANDSEYQRPVPVYQVSTDTIATPFDRALRDPSDAAPFGERFARSEVQPLSEPPVAEDAVTEIAAEQREQDPDDATAATVTHHWPSRLAIVYAWLTGVWLVASALLVIRLAVANLLMWRVRRAARPAPANLASQCRAIATALNIAAPAVLVGSRISSPCLIGCWRPAILLPAGLRAISGDALAHELAHLLRRDCLWNLISRLSVAVLPIQPLVWILARRMEHVADEVCDDYVLAHSQDRAAYARELVDIAERFQPDWSAATVGVGIAALKSSLGNRVLRILDTSRVLSTHTGMATLLAILAIGICGVVAAGFIAAPRNTSTIGADDNDESHTNDPGIPEQAIVFSSQDEGQDSIEVRGRVLDPNNKPFAGARLYVSPFSFDDKPELPVRTVTDEDGGFQFTFSKSEPAIDQASWASRQLDPWRSAAIVAAAEGYGPDWISVDDLEPGKELVLRLATDVPISGRIFDLEGRPIEGVSLRVVWLRASPDEDLTAWIEEARKQERGDGVSPDRVSLKELLGGPTGPPISVRTDADGRFRFTGLGRERAVNLNIEGPNIEHQTLTVLTRPGSAQAQRDPVLRRLVPVATFEHVSPPSQPIIGTVRDKTTGRPLAGISVRASLGTLPSPNAFATTDDEGRYRLIGLPDGKQYAVMAEPAGDRYLRAGKRVADAIGVAPITVDFELLQGVTVHGRMADANTGKPVRGEVFYVPYRDNIHADAVPDFARDPFYPFIGTRATAKDGSFTLAALPGPGVVAASALDTTAYMTLKLEDEEILNALQTSAPFVHAIATINPLEGSTTLNCRLVVQRGRNLSGNVLGPDGAPVTDVRVWGLKANPTDSTQTLETSTFTITGLNPQQRRVVVFQHRERELAATVVARGDEPGPLSVRLAPSGTVKGRLIDAAGQPEADIEVRAGIYVETRSGLLLCGIEPSFRSARTDAHGRFTIAGLLPGLNYILSAKTENTFRTVIDELSVASSETKDLGDVGKENARPSNTADSQQVAAKPAQRSDEKILVVRGRLLKADGTPAIAAKVYLVASYWGQGVSRETLETTADARGEFVLRYPETKFAGALSLRVIAMADGFGPDWAELDEFRASPQATLRLVADDVPINGRVLDLEGKPVAGAKVSLVGIRVLNTPDVASFLDAVKSNNLYSAFVRMWFGSLPAGPFSVETDQLGRFRLAGVGRGRVADLLVEGRAIEHNRLQVLTHVTEPVAAAERNTRMEPPKFYGATFDYFTLPSRPIVGTVRDKETGKPIAGVQITAGSMSKAISDEEGRFELFGTRKSDRYGVMAVPAAGQPYLIGSRSVPNTEGLSPLTADLELVRGIVVSGRVIDKATGKPVSASVSYNPLFPNEHLREGIGYGAAGGGGAVAESHTAADGSFSIAVLPGPGFIGVQAHDQRGYLPARVEPGPFFNDGLDYTLGGRKDLLLVAAGGQARSAIPQANFHAIVLLKPAKDEREFTRDVTLEAALSVSGTLVDSDGRPAVGTTAIGLASTLDHTPRTLEDASFKVTGLSRLYPRTVFFRHDEKRLAGVLTARGDEQQPLTVRLLPWGEVTGRIVDDEGNPRPRVKIGTITGRHAEDATFGRLPGFVATNDQGRFKIDGLVPDLNFAFEVMVDDTMLFDLDTHGPVLLKPGERKDLGDLHTKEIDTPALPTPSDETGKTAARSGPAENGSPRIVADAVTIRGRVVLNPDGKAAAGAKVLVVRQQVGSLHFAADNTVVARATTDDKGQFAVLCPTLDDGGASLGSQTTPGPFYLVLASRPGYATAWDGIDPRRPTTKEIELRLGEDLPIEGRVLDLEGKPVAGVAVRVLSIQSARRDANLDAWQAEAAKNPTNFDEASLIAAAPKAAPKLARFPVGEFVVVRELPVFAPEKTDDTGRFRISGLGRDRLVTVELAGAGIATTWVSAVTRTMQPVPFPTGDGRFRNQVCYGIPFDYVAEPGRTVRGVIRDADSKAPLTGVTVAVAQLGGSLLWVGDEFMHAITDQQGGFELRGLPLNGTHTLHVVPNAEQPYFRTDFRMAAEKGQQPIEMTAELRHGVWIRGRLIDRETRSPVEGWVSYYPYLSNTHAERFANFRAGVLSMGYNDRYKTDPNGAFRIPAIEGRGIILSAARNPAGYRVASGAESIEELSNANGAKRVYELMTVELGNAVREVEIGPGIAEVAYDLELVPAPRHRVALVDPQGQPLHGVQATGYLADSLLARNPVLQSAEPMKDAYLDVLGLDGGLPRTLVLLHKERDLGLTTVLDTTARDKLPKSLTLQPCGRVAGRLLDKSGAPLRGKLPHISVTKAETVYGISTTGAMTKTRQAVSPIGWVDTDDAGRFEFASVPPGSKYTIVVEGQEFATPVVNPGEKVELGDLQLNSPSRQEEGDGEADRLDSTSRPAESKDAAGLATQPQPTSAEQTPAAADARKNDLITVRGRVLDPEGKALGGARLYLHKPSKQWPKKLAEIPVRATTGADGTFRFSFSSSEVEPPYDSAPLDYVWVVAAAEGFGPDVVGPDQIKSGRELTLKLAKDDIPIVGRVVSLEGQPVPSAAIQLESIEVPLSGELEPWIQAVSKGGVGPGAVTRKYIMPTYCGLPEADAVMTDAQGRFRLTGIGRDRIIRFKLAGPNIVHQNLIAVTRIDPQHRGKYHEDYQRVVYDASFIHVAEPSRPVVGTVRDRETQRLLPGVRITGYGGVDATTGTDGRYRLVGLPKAEGREIAAWPTEGQPYFPSTTRTTGGVGLDSITVDFDLVRGIMVEGRVTEKLTGQPISARCTYFPLADNPNLGDVPGFLATGVTGGSTTQADGSFRIVALPGPGVVCVRATDDRYHMALITELTIDPKYVVDGNSLDTKPGRVSFRTTGANNFHVVAMIDPDREQKSDVIHIELTPGQTRRGVVVDPHGELVPATRVWGLTQTGWWKSLETASFEVKGLRPGEDRWLVFLHSEQRVAAAVKAAADELNPLTVQLQPCGTVTGRAVDPDGNPLAGLETRLFGIVFPDGNDLNQVMAVTTTDSNGRFRFEGLVPGVKYEYNLYRGGRYETHYYSVDPGETVDIGDCPKAVEQ